MNRPEHELIPSSVRNFIYRYLDSVESVKVLLLLHDDPSRSWSVDELTTELRSSRIGIERRLDALYDSKVLRKEGEAERHRYTPYDAEVSQAIEELSRYEKAFPYRVIDLIYSRHEDALREFANAFTFKKDK